jgi:hypothetical protein
MPGSKVSTGTLTVALGLVYASSIFLLQLPKKEKTSRGREYLKYLKSLDRIFYLKTCFYSKIDTNRSR